MPAGAAPPPASSKRRSQPWSGAAPTARASRSRSGRPSASRITRSDPNSSPASRPRTERTNDSSGPRPRRSTPCSIFPAISPIASPPPACAGSRTSATAPMPMPRGSSATAAAPTATSPTTGATSTPSRSQTSGDFANRRAPSPFRAKVGDGNPTAGCACPLPTKSEGVANPPAGRGLLGRGAHPVRGPAPESPESTGTKPGPACPSYCQPCRLLVIRARGRGASRQEPAMRPNNGAIKIVAGNSNPALADAIAAYLATPLTKAVVRRFADMEIFVEIQENVRGTDVFVIQSTSFPANDNLMELLIIIDALRRASGRRVTAVIPYFGYARQDRKPAPRTPISAKLVSNLITRAGADRVMTLDLHAGQIQGFFDIPTDNLYAAPMMVRDIKERFDVGKVMVVSPDVGGVGRARGLAKRINAPLAIVDKRRERAGESEVMNVIGEVDGYTCILVDDIIDSGGTVVNAADALLEKGATEVYAYISHGVLSGGAVARITASRLKELVITDSIQPTQAVRVSRNIRVMSVSALIGEAIGRTAAEESVSSLFD